MNTDAAPPTAKEGTLFVSVGSTVERLQREFLGDPSNSTTKAARASLAILRRSAGHNPESDPIGLQEVLNLLDPPLNESELGHGDRASGSERAAFHALTFYALHMQSAQRPAHVRQRSFGTAVGHLVARSESKSIKPRFDAMLSARSEQPRLIHLRSLITLLRGQEIGFDYAQFAVDLRTLSGPKYSNTLLKWGRDVVTGPSREDQAKNKAENKA